MSQVINEKTVGGIKREKHLVKYIKMGNTYSPIPETPPTVEALPAGVYKADTDMEGRLHITVHEAQTDTLLRFDDPRQTEIIQEVQKFWEAESKFKELGFTHKRGMLLTGEPGTGKSCILKLVMEDCVNKGDVVLVARSPRIVATAMKAVNEIESGRHVLVIMEDADELCQYSEHEMLQLFDGDNQFDNLLIIGTTNYPDRFNPRMLRPGRFDRKLKIGVLPEAGRRAYFVSKLGEGSPLIHDYVNVTDGFSFAQMREFLVSVHCLGHQTNVAADRIRSGAIEESRTSEEELDKALATIQMSESYTYAPYVPKVDLESVKESESGLASSILAKQLSKGAQ